MSVHTVRVRRGGAPMQVQRMNMNHLVVYHKCRGGRSPGGACGKQPHYFTPMNHPLVHRASHVSARAYERRQQAARKGACGTRIVYKRDSVGATKPSMCKCARASGPHTEIMSNFL
jgi:hypothetical protein